MVTTERLLEIVAAILGGRVRSAVCELGILVDDDWQHSGIAGLPMQAVVHAARERGYRTMEGLVLAQNTPMLRFTHALGLALEYLPQDPRTVRIVLDLAVHGVTPERTGAAPA